MALDQRKYERKHLDILRDVRPMNARMADALEQPFLSSVIFFCFATFLFVSPAVVAYCDLIAVVLGFYFYWVTKRSRAIAFKLPMSAPYKDKNNEGPGRSGKAEGILYLGNMKKTDEEIWFTNSDARTHILYLGTTGSGKTEGLKSMVTNALTWGSGFVYVDGKADTDLWSSLSALCRRFGRDDDLLVLNYMTGNSDHGSPSNTMNPFSSGSSSYLTNMLVQLMPEAEGDNAMWKERAVSLASAMMPALTWKRDNQEMPLSVRTIREYLGIEMVVRLSRDEAVPSELRAGLKGYLDTLPGFTHEAYDDEGKVKPPGPDTPQYDTTTANQQHGYLAMQFTRALQSLGDDYGYIFDTQAADVDMMDVVLNRRVLIVLIPALEKSGDEIANLGKIVAATMKGMMGATLGSTVEGESSKVIENKPTHSATPFMTVFDEVGYYTTQGMAVMAAQARSLGFCLVFSGQDLPAMKKRVREEANSITANCNIKIFGKLEDPTETKEFFEKTVGQALVTELSGYKIGDGSEFGNYYDTNQASVQVRARASYDGLRALKEGEAVLTFGEAVIDAQIFYSNPGHAKAMRVTRYMALPKPSDLLMGSSTQMTRVRDRLVNPKWSMTRAEVAEETPAEIKILADGFKFAEDRKADPIDMGIAAIVHLLGENNPDILIAPALPQANEEAATAKPQTSEQKPGLFTPQQAPEKAQENKSPSPETTTIAKDNAAPKDKESSGAPMSFFGSENTPGDTPAQDSAPSFSAAKPEENSAATPEPPKETASTPMPDSAQKPRRASVLSRDVLDILVSAGKSLQKNLFRIKDGETANES